MEAHINELYVNCKTSEEFLRRMQTINALIYFMMEEREKALCPQ